MQLTDFLDRVGRGDVAAVAAALDAHPEWLAAQGQNERLWSGGFNALAVATLSGQTAVVQLLLARGAHLTTPVAAGVSPIALAAVEGLAGGGHGSAERWRHGRSVCRCGDWRRRTSG